MLMNDSKDIHQYIRKIRLLCLCVCVCLLLCLRGKISNETKMLYICIHKLTFSSNIFFQKCVYISVVEES